MIRYRASAVPFRGARQDHPAVITREGYPGGCLELTLLVRGQGCIGGIIMVLAAVCGLHHW